MLVEGLLDRFNAFSLKNCPVTVHTENGLIGGVVKTSIIRGEVVIRTGDNRQVALPGRKVADLDTFLAPPKEKKAEQTRL